VRIQVVHHQQHHFVDVVVSALLQPAHHLGEVPDPATESPLHDMSPPIQLRLEHPEEIGSAVADVLVVERLTAPAMPAAVGSPHRSTTGGLHPSRPAVAGDQRVGGRPHTSSIVATNSAFPSSGMHYCSFSHGLISFF
jgi:hypothetical protein